jgi:hypothetical protein
MRVLLARRFRGNSNAAHLLEEEGEHPQGEVGEEEELQEEVLVAGQSSQARAELQDAQTKPQKSHQKPQKPRDTLLFTEKDGGENRAPQIPLSTVPSQQQKPLQQRKRRLAKSAQEENDSKLRRRQASVSSTKEEPSLLDRKPRAREIESSRKNLKRSATFLPTTTKVASAAGENTIAKEAALSSALSTSSQASPPLTNKSNTSKASNHKMVSGGPGRNHHRRHDNSREGDGEEHLLNWQYSINNHQPHHGEPDIIVQATPASEFEGPLENDPASARGDVSSASPERQTHDDSYTSRGSSSSVPMRDSSFVVRRREESPSFATAGTRNLYRIAPSPRISNSSPGSRDMSRIAPAAGSERGTYSLPAASQSGRNSNINEKKASTTAEEERFRTVLKKERGLEIREQDGDGNCLFRAISLQVYGDPSMHGDVRKQCMDHMVSDWLVGVLKEGIH